MGRKALPMAAEIAPEQPLAPDLMNNLNALAEHQQAIMEKYGEGLPYERERIVHEARFYMAQSAEAMLEAGKRLLILKENEPRGEFTKIVKESLGIPYRTAARMIQVSIKYLSPTLKSNLPTLAGLEKAKRFELMTEDDEDLAELRLSQKGHLYSTYFKMHPIIQQKAGTVRLSLSLPVHLEVY